MLVEIFRLFNEDLAEIDFLPPPRDKSKQGAALSRVNDAAGRVLAGRYELVEQIGEGGMAVVWRAIQRGSSPFKRAVAVKRIRSVLARSTETLEMFAEEARVGCELQHPNIVGVLDYGFDENGEAFLVTELVNGMHFGDWVVGHVRFGIETPWELTAAIGVEVLRGLDAAHTRLDANGEVSPILHRDVTPPNILLDESGSVKLADFGLARAMDRDRLTRPEIVKGKAAYLSPELVRGEPPSVQSDLFAVGIVLWEALSGNRLFKGENEVMSALLVRDAKVPMLGLKRPNLPLGVSAIVHRALEREPANRFGSAREMLEALRGTLRILPHSTDSFLLRDSVVEARKRLAAS
jgi:serine/threonine protein kinase